MLPSVEGYFVININNPKTLPSVIKNYLLSVSNKLSICYHAEIEKICVEDILKNFRYKLLFKSSRRIHETLSKLFANYDRIEVEFGFIKPYIIAGHH